jgi:hypothetical protein
MRFARPAHRRRIPGSRFPDRRWGRTERRHHQGDTVPRPSPKRIAGRQLRAPHNMPEAAGSSGRADAARAKSPAPIPLGGLRRRNLKAKRGPPAGGECCAAGVAAPSSRRDRCWRVCVGSAWNGARALSVSEYSANSDGPVSTAENGGGLAEGAATETATGFRSGWLVPSTIGHARHRHSPNTAARRLG